MERIQKYSCACIALIFAAGFVIGCSSKTPEEKVAEIRSLYSARLNGFIIEEEPIAEPMPEVSGLEETEPGAGEEPETPPADESAEIGEEPVYEPIPVRQQARLDLLIQHDSYDLLPGVTVDISMADASGNEKDHWRVWFDTADVGKATVTQFTHILEDIAYEEGDGFFAEIRNPIPVDERNEYREFSEISGDG